MTFANVDTRLVTPLVLLVDDYADTRELYRLVLEGRGFRVVEAVNGAEAIEHARTLGPALVVMDLAMPVMDGWAAARWLKAAPETAGIPIVALTAHASERDRLSALAAGCDAFVAKPCLPAQLVAHVERLLSGLPRPADGPLGGEPAPLLCPETSDDLP